MVPITSPVPSACRWMVIRILSPLSSLKMMLSASSTEGAVSETVLDPAVAVVLIMVVYLVLLMVCRQVETSREGRKADIWHQWRD
jgi:hypothetical protein